MGRWNRHGVDFDRALSIVRCHSPPTMLRKL